jgi:hypothetical protein
VRALGLIIGALGLFLCLGLLLALPSFLGRLSEDPPRILSPIIAIAVIGFFIRVGWRSVVRFSPEVVWCIFGVFAVLASMASVYLISEHFIQPDRVDHLIAAIFVLLPVAGGIYHLISTRTIRALFPDHGSGLNQWSEAATRP